MIDSFVYKWTNITLGKIYIGFHKGTEHDGYICSSRSSEFWQDFNNSAYEWKREILYKGTMKECQLLESNLLDSVDIRSESVYNNKNNIMFNLTDEVRQKLSIKAKQRSQNKIYISHLSKLAKKQWENPTHRAHMSKINKDKKHSKETIEKIKRARAEQTITPESRQKAAEKIRGIPRDENTKNAISLARTNAPNIICPRCGKIGKYGGSMFRWHFDKCREML